MLRNKDISRFAISAKSALAHKVALVATAAVLVFCLLTSFMAYRLNHVTVTEDGQTVTKFTTFKSDEKELLEAAAVQTAPGDVVSVSKEKRNITIAVKRAFPVEIVCADETVTVYANTGDTVADVFAKAKLEYADEDSLSLSPEKQVERGMEIKFTRRTYKNVTVEESIPFETVTEKSDALPVGETKIRQEGKKGTRALTYRVQYEDGEEVSRSLVSEEVTVQPKKCIKLEGTRAAEKTTTEKPAKTASSKVTNSGAAPASLASARKINVQATAYCYSDDGGSVTCMGIVPYRGIVAVDPKVIPLGTKMYITSADGSFVYGYAVAGDTGGAIKGNRIDLFMETSAECYDFGRRQMVVYILD